MMRLEYAPEALSIDRLLPVLSVEAIRQADRSAIDSDGIPGLLLMETAGRAVFRAVQQLLNPPGGRLEGEVAVFCGPGNNGGDGYVVARLLAQSGRRVRVIVTGEPKLDSDAGTQARLFQRVARECGDHCIVVDAASFLSGSSSIASAVCVDALLGTGVDRELQGDIVRLVDWINASCLPVVAVDVPTGLNAATGESYGTCVRAAKTVTLAALKTGLVIGDGPRYAGVIEIAEIGVPRDTIRKSAETNGDALAITDAAVRSWLPRRQHDAHKYSAGFVLVVAGSEGMAGAAIMASQGAARMGSGYVTCATPETVASIVAGSIPTSTTIGLPMDGEGIHAGASIERLARPLERADALVIGPGLGRRASTVRFVRELLAGWDRPAVIDADAIAALSGVDLSDFPNRRRWVVTPHGGEFESLTGEKPTGRERLHAATDFACRHGITLVLKGSPSVIGRPEGPPLVSTTGHESLATAGTGDVLSGMCGALLAQGLAPDQAAASALHLGGIAARTYSEQFHPASMVATDLLGHLPQILLRHFSNS